MERKTEEDLFQLIKSLSNSEKRSFNLYANYASSNEKIYLRLFKIIDAQKKYNKEKINKKLKEENIRTPLPRIKNYLTTLIIKALRFHHSGKTIEGQIRDLFADVEIYHAKGFLKLRDQSLLKIKSIAFEYEKYDITLQVLLKQIKQISYEHYQTKECLLLEYEQIAEKIIQLREYLRLINLTNGLLLSGSIRDEKANNEWLKIIQHPLMDKNKEPSGYREKYYYHQIWMAYYNRTNNLEKSIFHLEIIIKDTEARSTIIKDYAKRYIGQLSNLISSYCQNQQMNKAESVAYKLFQIQRWDINGAEKLFVVNYISFSYCNLLAGYLSVAKIEDAVRIAKAANLFLKNNNLDPHYKLSLLLNLSIIYLIMGDYKKAFDMNRSFLDNLTPNYRVDGMILGKILNLIIHYELGNFELLPYLVRSIYRVLKKRNNIFQTEELIVRFIRNKLPKSNSRAEFTTLFKTLKLELEDAIKDPYEQKALDSFDFISWLNSKIQNRPFADIVREKVGLAA